MKKVTGFKNVNVLIDNQIVKTNIIIKDGLISKIGNELCDQMTTLDDKYIVVPGFIDEHLHGANGYDFMDGKDFYHTILENVAKDGVTSVVATTSTNSIEKLEKTVLNINEYMKEEHLSGAKIIGIHLEGPFISKEYKGAQLEEFIIDANVDIMEHLINLSDQHILLITLEVKGNLDFIKYLKNKQITVSVGHSNATYEEILAAQAVGLTSVTHTFNAQSKIHHRQIGVSGAALLNDDLYTELICDGIHVSKEAVRLITKNKPQDKLILITDSLRQKGLKDGIYYEDGQIVYLKNNIATLNDGTLVGSTLSMNKAIKNIMLYTKISLIQAIKYATENPAKNLKLFDQIGSIKEGKVADLVVIDQDVNVYMTIKNGKIIYTR